MKHRISKTWEPKWLFLVVLNKCSYINCSAYMRNQIILIIILAISVLCTCPVHAISWKEPVSLLGMRIDSDKFKVITSAFGPATHMDADSETTLHFERVGITFTCIDKSIKEVIFQVAPGKKIIDAPYSGTLPSKVFESRSSPEKAIKNLGVPIEDKEQDYRKLKYSIGDKYIILYYGPQLDYVSIISKPVHRQN